MSPPTLKAISPRSRQSRARSSPSAGSVSFHQTWCFSAPSGVRPAALDDQRGAAEVPDEMVELGRDVAGVEVDDERLHAQDVGRARLAVLGDGAGDDVDRGALAPGPGGEGRELLGRALVRLDPDVVRLAALALALVDEAADRDQPVAVAEDDVEEGGDLACVGVDAERVVDDCAIQAQSSISVRRSGAVKHPA